jgi:hypothetical protein
MKENLYTQMQQNAENMDFVGSGLVNSPINPNSGSPYRNHGSGTSDGKN